MAMPDVDGRPYERQQVQGHQLNNRTIAMLTEAESRLGYDLTILQGSYNAGGVGASAGTHDGGGAVDLAPFDWDGKNGKVAVLRRIGFAAWHRPELWVDGRRVWGEHIHAVAIGDRDLAPAAETQVADYKAHKDGLASHAFDPFPYHPDGRNFDYADWRGEQRQAEMRRRRRRSAFRHALASLIRLRRLTDDKADKTEIQRTIESLRKH